PPVSPLARTHRRKQDLRSTFPQHPPQSTRAFAHAHIAEFWQTHHSRLLLLANVDRRCGSRALVPKPKGLPRCRLALELGKPRRLSLALSFAAGGEALERAPQIDCGLLEHLLANLCPPDQPGPGFITPCSFRPLPCVEGIDEIEAGPGNFGGLGALARLSLRLECVHYQAQALIERKASGAHVPAERLLLLPAGQQREAEGGVTAHASHPDKARSEAPSATNPRYDRSVLSYLVAILRNCFRQRSMTLRSR